jgi:hypothetical protein
LDLGIVRQEARRATNFVMLLPLVLLMVPAVILSANAVPFWPARAAARMSPARVLRAE